MHEVPLWPTLHDDALYGLVGEIVDTVAPHTEADPAALAATILVKFGAAADKNRYAVAGGVRHPARLNIVLVGKTSRARKGTSEAEVTRFFELADKAFTEGHEVGGLSSGEGLIYAVRDGADEEDPGVLDKRLYVYEPEYSRVLAACSRNESTLSEIIRLAWDGKNLRTMTRKNPLKATGSHICVLAHITAEELRRSLTDTQIANGFGNRFVFLLVERKQKLPSGGNLQPHEIVPLAEKLKGALKEARLGAELKRSPEADELWAEIYNAIDDEVGGMFGAITARAEAQMLRLSVCYALLDRSTIIELPHLKAAKAMWDYAEASAKWLFGETIGDEVADKLLAALCKAGDEGLDSTQQYQLFGRHIKQARLDAARRTLEAMGLIKTSEETTGGRPRGTTYALPISANKAKEAKKVRKPDPSPDLDSHKSLSSQEEEERDRVFREALGPIEAQLNGVPSMKKQSRIFTPCPDCGQRVADLTRHVELNHARKARR